jgi:tetratricopeptide (TPR) repeat protein
LLRSNERLARLHVTSELNLLSVNSEFIDRTYSRLTFPTRLPPYNELGYANRKFQQNEAAIEAYSRSLELDADSAIPHFGSADVYFYNLQRYDDAAAEYRAGLRLAANTIRTSKLADAHLRLGISLAKLEDLIGVLVEYEILAAMDPDKAAHLLEIIAR